MLSEKWLQRFYNSAKEVSTWSKDPDAKVGAVIVKDNRKISEGFNGYPKGVKDIKGEPKWVKLEKTIHAEVNAILFSKQDLENTSIIVTHHPCASCAGFIIQAGIKHVYCAHPLGQMTSWTNSFEIAKNMFKEANVELTILEY